MWERHGGGGSTRLLFDQWMPAAMTVTVEGVGGERGGGGVEGGRGVEKEMEKGKERSSGR